jgi:hypothetical protein
MKLTQPELRRVWPGAPSLTEPQGEMRILYDELICYDDVLSAVAASPQKPEGKYSTADIRLLGKALENLPEAKRPGLPTEFTLNF